MHFDQQLDVRSDLGPNSFDQRDCPHSLGQLELVVARPEWVEFHRPIPALHDLARGAGELLGRALDGVPAVGVRLDALAHRPAQQLVHGDAQRLGLDVHAGDLECGNRRHGDLAHPRVVVTPQGADQVLGVEGIEAEHVARHALR